MLKNISTEILRLLRPYHLAFPIIQSDFSELISDVSGNYGISTSDESLSDLDLLFWGFGLNSVVLVPNFSWSFHFKKTTPPSQNIGQ